MNSKLSWNTIYYLTVISLRAPTPCQLMSLRLVHDLHTHPSTDEPEGNFSEWVSKYVSRWLKESVTYRDAIYLKSLHIDEGQEKKLWLRSYKAVVRNGCFVVASFSTIKWSMHKYQYLLWRRKASFSVALFAKIPKSLLGKKMNSTKRDDFQAPSIYIV